MREIIFEYGFQSINGIVKKRYHLNEIPYIREKCDVWNKLPVAYIREWTGLTDKNGTKIFEGDILKSNKTDFYLYGDKTEVYFLNGSFCISILYDMTPLQLFDFDRVYKPSDYPDNTEKSNWLEEFEVIGNIHENLELLK